MDDNRSVQDILDEIVDRSKGPPSPPLFQTGQEDSVLSPPSNASHRKRWDRSQAPTSEPV